MKIRYIIILILLNGLVFASQFGKNIVQYNEFDWFYTPTDHFDLYF